VATTVLAGIPPADLLARERETEYLRRRNNTDVTANQVPEYPMMTEWQRRWDHAETGLWTSSLIPDLPSWTRRKFGELNFHLSQFLSGHGCFEKYLHSIRKVESTECVDCGVAMDDAEHALFSWWQQKAALEVVINRT